MRRPPRLSIALWVSALLVGVVAVGWTFLRGDAPARAGLPAVAAGLPAAASPATDGSTRDGDWRVVPADDVFVGYRATEKWAADRFTKTAVGRTGAVEGSLRIDGDRLVRVEVEADLGVLSSDQSARDAYLRTDGLETDRFPETRFRLGAPVDLPPSAVGEVVELRLDGELTLHGTTHPLTVALQARFSGTSVEVAGAAEVVMTDFGIDPPRTPFIEVDERAELELQLAFVRPAA
jgi:polyisoprenoid-binding protein YceI